MDITASTVGRAVDIEMGLERGRGGCTVERIKHNRRTGLDRTHRLTRDG